MPKSHAHAIARVAGNKSMFLLALVFIFSAGCRDAYIPTDLGSKRIKAPSSLETRRFAVKQNGRRIPDEYIVVFDDSEADPVGKAQNLLNAHGGNLKRVYRTALRGFSAHLSENQAEDIASEPGVAFVEQDRTVAIAGTEANPPSWGLDRIDQEKLPLDRSYSYEGDGAGVNVYVIDAGVRHTHIEFGGRAVPAFSVINDGYGPDGCLWHGTHVAATIAGVTTGVAKAATVYSVRVFDCTGSGSTSDVIAGVDWVTANRKLPAVANMSLSGDLSPALTSAIQNGIAAGVTFVVAAGNASGDACNYSPGNVAGAITVGASTWSDGPLSYSNSGSCLDLYAPGDGIISATNTADDAYYQASGTSMATPHVSGAAALYLQKNPGAAPEQTSQAIISNASTSVLNSLARGTANRLLRTTGLGGSSSAPLSAPSASFGVSCARNRNDCLFDASASSDPQGISNYSWEFGDGTYASGSAMVKLRHAYQLKGNFVVTLTVTDGTNESSRAQRTVAIKSVK